MIEFYSETNFQIKNKKKLTHWISRVVEEENQKPGEITYVFCDDEYLFALNKKFLNHDTLTDIITFDNNVGEYVNGDIFISVDRVKENATNYNTTFLNELHRVMIHGIFHLCGYKDKKDRESKIMRSKEDDALLLLNSL